MKNLGNWTAILKLTCFCLFGVSLSPAQTIAIRCGINQTYVASDGTTWMPDQYFAGGEQLYTSYSVLNTSDPTLYRWARQGYYGDFSYNIPVANGNYELTLKFAEIQYSSAGSRVFNVTVNGNQVLTNFDIVAQAGYWTAIDKQFPVAVSTGAIQITVHGVVGVGVLSALEIVPASGGQESPALQLSTNALNFSGTAGGSNPAPQNIAITNAGGGTLNWTASATQPWVQLSASSGTAPGNLSVTTASAGLAAGTYTDIVTVSAPGASSSPQTVGVTLTVSSNSGPSINTAAYVRLDTAAQGTWQGVYGTDGYDIAAVASALPSYAQVAVNGASSFTWAAATGDTRALQQPNGSNRIAATWYASGSFSFDVNFTDGATHPFALYALDFDNWGRSERVDVLDGTTGTVLDSRTLSSFSGGEYLVWNLSGHLIIRVTQLSGPNAVVSGLFFGATASQNSPATLNVSANTLNFSAVAGGNNPGSQNVAITNTGSGSLSWTASKTQAWLTMSATSGVTPANLSVGAGTSGLSAGTYTDFITIAASGGSGSPQIVKVTLVLGSSSAALSVSQTALSFASSAPGSNPASQLVTISNTGSGSLSWTAAKTQSWLTLSASSGTAPSTLSIGVMTAQLTAGTYTDSVQITAPGASGSPVAIAVTLVVGSAAGQHYVSPQGSPAGDGSISNPWDLQTALSQPSSVKPGDIIWVRGGTYGNGTGVFYSSLVGTAVAPIIVRQYPGERATIDGWLQVGCCDQNPQPSEGAYVWFWGLEFASSVTDRTGLPSGQSAILDAVDTWAPGTKFINNIVHDSRVGISMWKEAVGAEAYGNVIYFNGFQASDRAHGHGFYIQNENGTMNITDNIIFDQFDEGMQFYGTSAAYEKNLVIQGNVAFNNGSISAGPALADDIVMANPNDMSGVQLLNNYFYFTPALGLGYNELGWSAPNQDIVVQGNYFIGGFEAVALTDWASINFQNNTIFNNKYLIVLSTQNTPSGYIWDNNTYYGTGEFSYNGQGTYLAGWQGWTGYDIHSTLNSGVPTGVWTFVEPNKYEPGRANIVIYNWDLISAVSVDVSGVVTPGTRYKILDAQNYFGPPVVQGTYDGTPIIIPMTGLTIATPNGNVPTAPVHTAPQLGTFVLIPVQ